jgi:hypothetical protein
MENFQVVRNESTGKEKAQAISGKHDDLVMAFCGFFLCRGAQRATVKGEAPKSRAMTIEELEEKLERRARADSRQERNVLQIWD